MSVTQTEAANADLIRLDNKKYGPLVAEYADNQAAKKKADADSRAADKIIKSARGQLLSAILPARAAVCGNRVLTVKDGTQVEAAITLRNGRRILWSDVSVILVGKERIGTDEVATLYGGRSSEPSIEVA